jgi:catechol 2,3-dioxygenase-like lactoylglutathione lyase family enzyme
MEFRGVHHVSLNVTDVEAATRFYTEVLGLELLERPNLSFPGAWLAAGSQQIHLLGVDEFEAPEGQHFALQVDDIDATILTLADRGVETTPAKEITGVCRQAFFQDPTGNLIELNQPLT